MVDPTELETTAVADDSLTARQIDDKSPQSDDKSPDTTRRIGDGLFLLATVAVAGAIAAPVLWRLAGGQSDIPAHAKLAIPIFQEYGWFSYSAWYPLMYFATSHGQASATAVRAYSAIFLTMAVMLKAVIAYFVAWYKLNRRWVACAIALALVCVMALPNPLAPSYIYLGSLSPSVWHNSTEIIAAPMAILAFVAAVRMLKRPTLATGIVFAVAALGSAFMKPSYCTVLLPVVGIYLIIVLAKHWPGWRRSLAVIGAGFIPVTLLLLAQYLNTYGKSGIMDTTTPGIDPFVTWESYTPSIPISILVSLAGPILTWFFVGSKTRRSPAMLLSWITMLFGIAQALLLVEIMPNGGYSTNGNFFWGALASSTVLFLVSMIATAQVFFKEHPRGWRKVLGIVTVIVFLGHVATGIFYMTHAGLDGFPVTGQPTPISAPAQSVPPALGAGGAQCSGLRPTIDPAGLPQIS